MEIIILTLVGVTATFKLSKALTYRLLSTGKLPFTQYRHRVVVKLEDLIAFIAKTSTTNTYLDSQEEANPLSRFNSTLAKLNYRPIRTTY